VPASTPKLKTTFPCLALPYHGRYKGEFPWQFSCRTEYMRSTGEIGGNAKKPGEAGCDIRQRETLAKLAPDQPGGLV